MRIQSTISELWWLGNADEVQSQRPISLFQILNVVRETFNFFSSPTAIPTGNDGFKFQHGSYLAGMTANDFIVIPELVVFAAAIHITVAGETAGADKVFAKIKELLLAMGVREPITPPVTFYRSTMVCDFDKPLDKLLASYGDLIAIIQGKGCLPEVPVHFTGIAFSADASTVPITMAAYNPTLFSINRKIDAPFSMNRFTCFANLTTGEHVEALKRIEALV